MFAAYPAHGMSLNWESENCIKTFPSRLPTFVSLFTFRLYYRRIYRYILHRSTTYIHCVSKKNSHLLTVCNFNLNQFSKFLQCWKAYEIYYKTHMTLPTANFFKWHSLGLRATSYINDAIYSANVCFKLHSTGATIHMLRFQ